MTHSLGNTRRWLVDLKFGPNVCPNVWDRLREKQKNKKKEKNFFLSFFENREKTMKLLGATLALTGALASRNGRVHEMEGFYLEKKIKKKLITHT